MSEGKELGDYASTLWMTWLSECMPKMLPQKIHRKFMTDQKWRLKDGEMENDSKICGQEGRDKESVCDRNEQASV